MLKPRLKAIYNLIPNNTKHVVDIGSDHAYLCIELLKNKNVNFVSNIEINIQPLQNGLNNVKNHHLDNKAAFYLNDGLKDLQLDHIDYVCISGMGADNIISIIENNNYNTINYFVLQPNADVNKLKSFLLKNNFTFIEEQIIKDNNRFYEILLVQKSNKKENSYCDEDIHIGPILKTKDDLITKEYFLNKYTHLKKIPFSLTIELTQKEITTIKDFLYAKKWIN